MHVPPSHSSPPSTTPLPQTSGTNVVGVGVAVGVGVGVGGTAQPLAVHASHADSNALTQDEPPGGALQAAALRLMLARVTPFARF
jgi:hypothetical protein